MSELDLNAIRERSETYTLNRDAEANDPGSITTEYVAESALLSANDVPALIAEVERHRRIIKLVTELTHDTDGDDLDPDENIPVGEVMRALAGVAL